MAESEKRDRARSSLSALQVGARLDAVCSVEGRTEGPAVIWALDKEAEAENIGIIEPAEEEDRKGTRYVPITGVTVGDVVGVLGRAGGVEVG